MKNEILFFVDETIPVANHKLSINPVRRNRQFARNKMFLGAVVAHKRHFVKNRHSKRRQVGFLPNVRFMGGVKAIQLDQAVCSLPTRPRMRMRYESPRANLQQK